MYREDAPDPGLAKLLSCTWVHRTSGSAQVWPDACLDILWNGRALIVAGPDTHAVTEHVAAAVHGVRFKTGCATLGIPASALRDARVPLSELWDVSPWLDRLQHEAPTVVLQDIVRAQRGTPDRLVLAAVSRLRAQPALRITALARELGVSERQLNRRITHAVGYGPKLLARILRMQSFVRALREGEPSLAALAARLGFSDQAHLAHEASELYRSTPARLRRRDV